MRKLGSRPIVCEFDGIADSMTVATLTSSDEAKERRKSSKPFMLRH